MLRGLAEAAVHEHGVRRGCWSGSARKMDRRPGVGPAEEPRAEAASRRCGSKAGVRRAARCDAARRSGERAAQERFATRRLGEVNRARWEVTRGRCSSEIEGAGLPRVRPRASAHSGAVDDTVSRCAKGHVASDMALSTCPKRQLSGCRPAGRRSTRSWWPCLPSSSSAPWRRAGCCCCYRRRCRRRGGDRSP